jgi:hypothetical protein
VLHSIDLTLLPGTVTALCGGSGGGKSSIAGLVLRNYDVLVGRERRGVGGGDERDAACRGAEVARRGAEWIDGGRTWEESPCPPPIREGGREEMTEEGES